MAGVKFWNTEAYGGWNDLEDYPGVLKKWNGSSWVDGNSSSTAVINKWNGNAWIQLFPKTVSTISKTFTSSNLSYTHTGNSSTWTSDKCNGGTYNSNDYTGWMNINSSGVSGVLDIESITATYTRRGVGNNSVQYPIAICPSTLTTASGSGSTAHSSKVVTIISDTNMLPCSGTDTLTSGSTTFNSTSSKTAIKNWMNSSSQSLVLGSKENSTNYISLSAFSMVVNYTSSTYLATFSVSDNSQVRLSSGDITMPILEEEFDMSLEDILQRREDLGIEIIT